MHSFDDHPADHAPRPIVGEAWDRMEPRAIPWHSHQRGQFIHVLTGCVTVQSADGLYVLPPHRAIWLPPETRHCVRYPGEIAFRGLFLDAVLSARFPARPTVMQVDALTRELIDKAARLPWDYPPDGREARLFAVLIDQLIEMRTAPLSLPDAQDKRLQRIMEALRADPADDRPIGAWANFVHMSERTLARRFVAETGMSFGVWRQQLRLLTVIERLAAGDPVTTIAIDLGYGTPSSLTTMFKKALGVPPSRFFETR